MSYSVEISDWAEAETRENYFWWADNRSPEQAERWLLGIRAAMLSLRDRPERYPLATEIDLREAGIRQAPFGLGRTPSHRIIFGIDEQTVIVYRVRAFKQRCDWCR